MRCFVVFVIIAVYAIKTCNGDFKSESIKECTQKLNVSSDEFKKAMTGETKPADVNPMTKCSFLCISEKDGLVKDGVFQIQTMADKLFNSTNKDVVLKTIATCKDLKGTNNCDTAYKITSCIHQGKRA